jgi:poly(3-hydroxybutyrate) depolymerase
MSSPRSVSFLVTCSAATVLAFTGCGTDSSTTGTGGTVGTGGATTGGSPGSGGTTPKATGGVAPTATGGVSTGGTSTGGGGGGGKATGGVSTGGASTGGASNGGASGGSGGGGKATAGSGGLGTAGMAGSAGATGGQGVGGGTAGAGGSSPMTPGKSAGCGTTPTIASGMYNNGTPIPITVGGVQRRFILNVPTNYDNTKPYKLIIAWHQLDGNDKQMYADKYYRLLDLSENSTIFVAPNGEKGGQPCTGMGNGESQCGWPDAGGRNVDLADAVVALIQTNFCIDTNRIFATGWSYGGSMSYRTACSRPLGGGTASWGVRGVAVYSGAQLSGMCTPSKAVAYYHSHGTNDTVLGYDQQNNPDGAGVGLAKNFSTANGCTWKTPTKVTNGAHICSDMVGCMTGYPVKFCSFAGGHTPYPDQGNAGSTWQPPVVWEFFNQF